MVIPGIKFKRTPIIEGVEISKVREFRWDGNGLFPSDMTIQDPDLMIMGFQ
jgi:hypothetical protein